MGPVIRPCAPGMFDNPGDEEVLFVMIMSDLNTVTAPALPALQGSLDRSPTGDTPNCDSALTICPIKGDMDLAGGCSLSELPRDQCLPRRIAGGGGGMAWDPAHLAVSLGPECCSL